MFQFLHCSLSRRAFETPTYVLCLAEDYIMSTPTPPLAPEIVWWTPSDAFLENPEEFREYLDLWTELAQENLFGIYFGAGLDNSGSRIWVSIWKSLAHHHAFMQDAAHVDLGLSLMDAMVGPNKIHQALVSNPVSNLDKALRAPVTQFIYITMRPLHDRGYELEPLIEKLQAKLVKIPACIASCWGPSVEKEKLMIGTVGWTNLEAKNMAVNGPLFSIISRIRELSNVEILFASLVPSTDDLF